MSGLWHSLRNGRWTPSLGVVVPVAAAVLVLASAVGISATAADELRRTAIDEAVRAVGAVVHGYVDPLLADASLPAESLSGADPQLAASVNRQLADLTAGGQILRIKVWRPDGTVVFSDLPALRGRHFPMTDELAEALAGGTATEITTPSGEENLFERDLAPLQLEIYLPIVPKGSDHPVGAYEIYQDAAPLQAGIDTTRRNVLLISAGLGLVLLVLLWGSFRGANRLLSELARRLRGSEARFRSLVQNSSDVVLVVTAEGTAAYVSPAIGSVLGVVPEAWLGARLADLVHPDDAAWMRAALDRLIADAASSHDGEVRVQHADGRWRWLEMAGRNLLADADVAGVVFNCRDVTERRELEEQLRAHAFADPLTGLANRALLLDRVTQDLLSGGADEAAHRSIAVALLDLDDFKTLNDSLGHAAGDELLGIVARRLTAAVLAGDTAARFGGDEFALLLHAPSRAEVVERLDRALEALRRPAAVAGQPLNPAASIGLTFLDRPAASADEVVRNADVAMNIAKARGKDRTVVFEAPMHEAAMRRLRLKEDLPAALEREEFVLHYQPILDLAAGEITGVEALVRWQRSEGIVPPDDFISLAEETGVIVPLGRWVLDTACRFAREMDAIAPRELRVSVNVSAVQLARAAFPDEVGAALRASGLAPGRLVLELTESLLLERSESIMASVRRLRQQGIRLAIDDFGTGYSSLSYLPELPVDILKIDRSFVAGLDGSREAPAVIRSIIRLANALSLTTVAEGIERPDQAARLRTLGAQQGQGYYFARPLTGEQLLAYLAGDSSEATSVAG